MIHTAYQAKSIAHELTKCHATANVEKSASFDQLKAELSTQIAEAMPNARQSLLENFDDEVQEKLCVHAADTQAQLGRYERIRMDLTADELNGHAHFLSDSAFELRTAPFTTADISTGMYELPRRSGEAHCYRLAHPLAQQLIEQAKARPLPPVAIDGYAHAPNKLVEKPAAPLATHTATLEQAILQRISERDAKFFEDEIGKLEAWADDRKVALDEEIKAFDRRIQETRSAALAAVTLEQKLAAQKVVKTLAKERTAKRRAPCNPG